jgi:hypothetical protein
MKILTLSFVLFFFVSVGAAQQLAPSPAQHKRLVKQQGRIRKYWENLNRATVEHDYEVLKLAKACEEIITANGWPRNTQCNPETLQFATPPQSPATPPTPTPTPTPTLDRSAPRALSDGLP